MKRVSHTKVFELGVPIDAVFPLFSPEGEKRWVPGWDYENVMGTTQLDEDYVFLTKTHDHRSADAIWIVKTYDPKMHFVVFYKIEPLEKIGVISVKCGLLGSNRTEVQVTYTYISLSAAGDGFVSNFHQETFQEFIGEWETLLLEYFNFPQANTHPTNQNPEKNQ